MINQGRVNSKPILALLAIYIGWGTTYLAIAVALEHFPPFMLAGIRFFLAGSIFFIWCIWKKTKIPSGKNVLNICLTGFFLLFLGSGSVIWVEQYLTTGLTSIVWASLPIWIVALDRKKWKYHLSNYKLLIGLIIGFVGVILLFWDKELINITEEGTSIAFAIALCGVLCFSIGSLYSKYTPLKGGTILIVAIQMMFVGALAIIVSMSIGEQFPVYSSKTMLDSILGLAYLIIVGSLIAYVAFIWLLGFMPPSVVGTYTYVNPAIAMLLGWYFLDENISDQKIMALVFIFAGVIVVNFYKSKHKY